MSPQHRCPSSLRLRGLVAPAAIAVLVTTTYCPLAHAEDAAGGDPSAVALAERRAAEAFQAYERKDYTAAVALYLQAYDAAPSGSILYNVARIYDTKLADRSLAITFYLRYLADPGAQTHLVEESTQRLRVLRAAELAASRTAATTADRSVQDGDVSQRAHDAPRAEHDSTQAQPHGWSAVRWVGVALASAGLAGVGVGSGFGWAAMSKASTAHELCDGNACTSQRGVDAAHTARTAATFSTLGFAVGGGLLAAGAALFFWGGDREPEQSARSGLHMGASATTSELSLQLEGRW